MVMADKPSTLIQVKVQCSKGASNGYNRQTCYYGRGITADEPSTLIWVAYCYGRSIMAEFYIGLGRDAMRPYPMGAQQ